MNILMNIIDLEVSLKSKVIFSNLNLKIYENEILTITGKSGIGKSTFLKCILGLEKYSGVILSDNLFMSYMPQNLALFEFKTVYDNVILPLKIKQDKVEQNLIDNVLEDLEIKHLKFEKISSLSGGEKSRVALARALVTNSKILLLDEPLSKLDYITKHNILEKLKKIKQDYKVTIVYVSHDIEEIINISDRILILKDKTKLIEDVDKITKEEIINSIKKDY